MCLGHVGLLIFVIICSPGRLFLWINNISSCLSKKKKFVLQDNVFVNVVASIQYRALADKASDAFYKLSNTRTQIQAYVFDGINWKSY